MQAAGQLTNLDQSKHDVLQGIEVSQPIEVLIEDGAEEPVPVQKDSCQQHSRMLKYKEPLVPTITM